MSSNYLKRRRNFYIKKEFQRNFILKFCALLVAGSVISGAIIYAMSAATVTTVFENSRLTIKGTADYILPTVIISSIVVVMLIGIATIIMTLLTSHKIAGPLYAIESRVDQVAALNLKTEFRLRAGDQIKPMAVGLDVMAHNLRKGVNEIKDALSELESSVNAAESGKLSPDIKTKLANVKESVNKFTT